MIITRILEWGAKLGIGVVALSAGLNIFYGRKRNDISQYCTAHIEMMHLQELPPNKDYILGPIELGDLPWQLKVYPCGRQNTVSVCSTLSCLFTNIYHLVRQCSPLHVLAPGVALC